MKKRKKSQKRHIINISTYFDKFNLKKALYKELFRDCLEFFMVYLKECLGNLYARKKANRKNQTGC